MSRIPQLYIYKYPPRYCLRDSLRSRHRPTRTSGRRVSTVGPPFVEVVQYWCNGPFSEGRTALIDRLRLPTSEEIRHAERPSAGPSPTILVDLPPQAMWLCYCMSTHNRPFRFIPNTWKEPFSPGHFQPQIIRTGTCMRLAASKRHTLQPLPGM